MEEKTESVRQDDSLPVWEKKSPLIPNFSKVNKTAHNSHRSVFTDLFKNFKKSLIEQNKLKDQSASEIIIIKNDRFNHFFLESCLLISVQFAFKGRLIETVIIIITIITTC